MWSWVRHNHGENRVVQQTLYIFGHSTLVADQEVESIELPEQSVECVAFLRLFQLGDQSSGGDEANPFALTAGSQAQRNGDVRFSSTIVMPPSE